MTPLLLSAVLALTPGGDVIPQPALAALERATRHYSDGQAHAATFAQTYTPSGFAGAKRESGAVWIQAPQRLRFEYVAPDSKVFTYDAGEGRFYSPEDGQLTVKKLSPEERARLPIVFLTDPDVLSAAYAITIEPADGGSQRLRFEPRAKRPELAWLRLAIAADGSVTALSYEDEGGNKTEFRFESWSTEKARPDADFRVTGPKGTRVIEQ
jgi:outer membrane lipoprotein-sorting protein